MSLENLTTEELAAEIERREALARESDLAELSDLEARAAAIRAKHGLTSATAAPKAAKHAARVATNEAILNVLASVPGPVGAAAIAAAIGADQKVTKRVLTALVEAGSVIQSGAKRGVKYALDRLS